MNADPRYHEPPVPPSDDSGPAMITMRQIRKAYRAGLVETEALSNISLTVPRGEFLAVMGPSGSGKTTFLNVAGLLDDCDGGEYLLDGQDVRALSDAALTRLRNQKIGFVFQSFNLVPDLDVYDNVELPLRYRGLKARERSEMVEAILSKLGLVSRMRHLPQQLSGGQQQRVAIARALVGGPRLLLADEPTGNLDSVAARQMMDLLEQLNDDGTTIVMVTHDHELAARAHRKLHILDGKLIDPRAPQP